MVIIAMSSVPCATSTVHHPQPMTRDPRPVIHAWLCVLWLSGTSGKDQNHCSSSFIKALHFLSPLCPLCLMVACSPVWSIRPSHSKHPPPISPSIHPLSLSLSSSHPLASRDSSLCRSSDPITPRIPSHAVTASCSALCFPFSRPPRFFTETRSSQRDGTTCP